jgi:anti-sigma B factor antagonist
MQQDTQVEIRIQDGIGIIDIAGEVTSFSEKTLLQAYEKLDKDTVKKLCLNFQNVSYINSAGMAILIAILTKTRQRDQMLRGFGLSGHFQKIFTMVGITKYMQHFDTEKEALRDF